jgi:transposase
VISCDEAGYDGFWLHRQLSAHGIHSLQVDRRADESRQIELTTERLVRSLLAYLRGEPKVRSVVRVPSDAGGVDTTYGGLSSSSGLGGTMPVIP